MSTEVTRHYELFEPAQFMAPTDKIDIIGAGATGSKVALELMKLGLNGNQLRVWDFDRVESHNISNQLFGVEDIGKLKVQALSDIIYTQTQEEITVEPRRLEPGIGVTLNKYVFLLTDTMSSRKEIWEEMIKPSDTSIGLIETRMGVDMSMTFTLWSKDKDLARKYEGNFYEDGQAEVSACGTTLSVGPTSSMLASVAVWQFMKLAKAGIRLKDSNPEFRVILNTNPFSLYSI